jgi:hypothetical protein
MAVDRIGNRLVSALGLVLVDHRGPFAVVSNAGHRSRSQAPLYAANWFLGAADVVVDRYSAPIALEGGCSLEPSTPGFRHWPPTIDKRVRLGHADDALEDLLDETSRDFSE